MMLGKKQETPESDAWGMRTRFSSKKEHDHICPSERLFEVTLGAGETEEEFS